MSNGANVMMQMIKKYSIYLFWVFILLVILTKCLVFIGFTLDKNHLSPEFLTGLDKALPYIPFYFGIVAFFLSFAFLLRNKFHQFYLIAFNMIISVLLLIDLWYYRGFNGMPPVQALKQTGNLSHLSDSIISLIYPADFVFVMDIPLLLVIMLLLFIYKKDPFKVINKDVILFAAVFAVSAVILAFAPLKTEIGGKKILDSQTSALRLSPIGYHLYNIYTAFRDTKEVALTSSDLDEIQLWFRQSRESEPDNKYKGLLAEKNLIFIQVESLEKFVINQKVEDQEITPNLNKLLKNALFFTNIYEQNNHGNSSDADLMYNTSIYPTRNESTFFSFPNTTYSGSLPKLFEKIGYSTLAIHPDEGTFWNWMPSLKSIGFQQCIGAESLVLDETILLGLSDRSFLKQVLPIVTKQKKPFYTFMITLSSHSPFNIPYYERTLKLKNGYNENIMEFYFQSLHYTDECIGTLIDGLDKEGFLDNTVVVISGDHAGINKYHKSEIEKLEPKESWWETKKQQVPFIVYSKGLSPEVFDMTGGQVDVLPTLAYLFGIEEKEYFNTAIGRNLLKTKKDFAVLANGSIVGSTSDEKHKELAVKGLDIADTIIKRDYFRSSLTDQVYNR